MSTKTAGVSAGTACVAMLLYIAIGVSIGQWAAGYSLDCIFGIKLPLIATIPIGMIGAPFFFPCSLVLVCLHAAGIHFPLIHH